MSKMFTPSTLPIWLFFLLLLVGTYMSCSAPQAAPVATKKVLPTEPHEATWKEQVLQANTNEQRLHLLLQGTYVRYHYKNKANNEMKPWLVNDGKDSVIYHIRPIGNPNREGYLLLHCLFMSHLPNQPLVTYVSKIERMTRDSFVLRGFKCSNFTLKEVISNQVEKQLDLKKLVAQEKSHVYTYVKKSNEQFDLSTPYSKYGYDTDEKKAFYRSLGYVNMMVHREDALFYNKEMEKTSSAVNYDVRRHDIDLKKLSQGSE